MAQPGRQQPPWKAPSTSASLPPIKIFNSLTRTKNAFVPLDPTGRSVTWYACGPTVYDDAHLGHARNYVTTDIVRRIMKYYFHFDVRFVMNITDVDDKIILRARQQYLFAQFRAENPGLSEAQAQAGTAWKAYAEKHAPRVARPTPAAWEAAAAEQYGDVLAGKPLEAGTEAGEAEEKVKMHLRTLASTARALVAADAGEVLVDDFYGQTEDVLMLWLDQQKGAEIDAEDHGIFTRLAKTYEQRFHEDMRALHCLDPDEITRVTEYGPQIVDYVRQIVDNGFGYTTSDGSVYFDIQAFERSGNSYARLEPWNRNDTARLADGEGSLTKKTTEKRSDADFALWKASKPGEPSWPSPWGKGRPGWHIECSAMASDKLGKTFDIHSGGIDLAFPHHDNELAQAEAYWAEKGSCCGQQWVNYFMHMGHLHIKGAKMSKSLKNFTTIRSALERSDWNPRLLRIVFLLGSWKDRMEVTDEHTAAARSWEKAVHNFFLKAINIDTKASGPVDGAANNGETKSAAADDQMLTALSKAQKELYDALADSFDTPRAMRVISTLVTEYNSADKATLTDDTLLVLATWVTEIVRIFGLDGSDASQPVGWAGLDIADAAKPFVYAVSALRDEVRARAKAGNTDAAAMSALVDASLQADAEQPLASIAYAEVLSQFQEDVARAAAAAAPAKEYLQLCDALRDVKLWDQGIYLEDSPEENQPAIVRPLGQEEVDARAQKEQRERDKAEAKAKKEADARARLEKGRLAPEAMFQTAEQRREFSAWDAEGLPVRDAEGKEVAKSKAKKLRKLWEAQKKLHEEWARSEAEAAAR